MLGQECGREVAVLAFVPLKASLPELRFVATVRYGS